MDALHLFGIAGGGILPAAVLGGFPGTKSFVLTCFDRMRQSPAASGAGPSQYSADVTSIDTGADAPAGALTRRNDAGMAGAPGAAPPAGHGPHRYIFCTAVDGSSTLTRTPPPPS